MEDRNYRVSRKMYIYKVASLPLVTLRPWGVMHNDVICRVYHKLFPVYSIVVFFSGNIYIVSDLKVQV
jgi:hypothetical protein